MKRTKSFDNSHFVLYLIATPIGNLSEISERALTTIKEMDIIAAEDTRNTGFLLNRYGFSKELFSLREHNENEASSYLISLIKNGKKVAYVSDAGYPGISDPGYLLVKNALKEDIAVSTISGPSAFINALVASGLETNHFYFHGFLPAKDSEAKEELEFLKDKRETLIFYESPHRIHRMLENLFEILGDRNAVIARELTKLNEEYIRGALSELVAINEQELKGEMVVMVEGNKQEETISDQFLIDKVNNLVNKGLSKKDAIDIVSDHFMVNKNRIKKLVL
ncbi:MAG: 16S rRNA (cytidine(1402)-2'-O)-methyltransferase [Bacilli bacterium]|nr:16S rRNA (cytidine(1402)-2'-O)-methyltransferase [Bacilli bacterium]